MPFERALPLSIGTSQAGLADLRAQLVTTAGVDTGVPITTGFFELPGSSRGLYGWHYAAFADGFRGFVRFYSAAAPTVHLAMAGVNPEGEAENTNIKTSATWDEPIAGHLAAGSTGEKLNAASAAGDPWTTPLPGAYGAGTAGALLSTIGGGVTGLIASLAGLAAAVWAYAVRTLTMTAAQVAAVLEGADLVIVRGTTVTISITGLGNLTSRTMLAFTAKNADSDLDSEAVFQITELGGLLVLNGAVAGTAGDGSILVTDQAAGDITIMLKPESSQYLGEISGLVWDVKSRIGAVTNQETAGTLAVLSDVGRLVS